MSDFDECLAFVSLVFEFFRHLEILVTWVTESGSSQEVEILMDLWAKFVTR